MFGVTFDMTVAELRQHYSRGVPQAYADIATCLGEFGFERLQGSVYLCRSNDLANLFKMIVALKAIPWFGPSLRDLRVFRVENGSDFTSFIKDERG